MSRAAVLVILAMAAAACGGGGNDGQTSTGGSSDGPRPMGDPALSVFTYSSRLSDPATTWEGTLLGLVETDTSSFNNETGRCLVLLGVATATQGPADANANPMLLPPIEMKASGEYVYPDNNKCDTAAIRAKGYDWLFNMEVPVGTSYPFFSEIFLPGANPATPESVILGNPVASDGAQYYEPTILSDIPNPPA